MRDNGLLEEGEPLHHWAGRLLKCQLKLHFGLSPPRAHQASPQAPPILGQLSGAGTAGCAGHRALGHGEFGPPLTQQRGACVHGHQREALPASSEVGLRGGGGAWARLHWLDPWPSLHTLEGRWAWHG